MSDTPRTDSEAFLPHDSKYQVCDADFARTLERELNAANVEIERLTQKVSKLYEGAEEQKQGIKRLEEAGDAVAAIIGPPGSAHWADENQVDAAWNNWTKAKEAKL